MDCPLPFSTSLAFLRKSVIVKINTETGKKASRDGGHLVSFDELYGHFEFIFPLFLFEILM